MDNQTQTSKNNLTPTYCKIERIQINELNRPLKCLRNALVEQRIAMQSGKHAG